MLLLLLLGAPAAEARPGQLDGSFGHHGLGGGGLGPHYEETSFYSVEEAPDGSILASRDELRRRYSATGAFRGKFRSKYVAPPPARAVAADGKVLEMTGGSRVRRLNPDGSIDKTFNGGETEALDFYIQALQPLPSGKVMAAGRAVYEPQIHGFIWQIGLALINPDGTLDPSFGGDGKVELRRDDGVEGEELLGLASRSEGAVVVGTDFVVAVGADGALDKAYGVAGAAPLGKSKILAFEPGPEGRVAVAGSTSSLECCTLKPSRHFLIAHLGPDGKPDPAYSGGKGIALLGGVEDRAEAALFADDGSVVLAGSTLVPGGAVCLRQLRCIKTMPALARFDSAGVPDAGFGRGGLLRLKALAGVGEQPRVGEIVERRGGGFLIAGGGGPLGSIAFLAALGEDGSFERRFSDDGLLTERAPERSEVEIKGIGTAPGGKVVVGAWSDTGVFSGPVLIRYGRDGRIDRSFGGGDGYVRLALEGGIESMAVDVRGGTVVLMEDGALAGVSPRGVLSPLFRRTDQIVPSGSPAHFRDVAWQPDGKILLVGTNQNHRARHANMFAARLLPSGEIDHSFASSGYATAGCPPHGRCRASRVVVQRDGRILLAGRMAGNPLLASEDLKSRAVVARLRPDGRPDHSFGGDGFVSLRITHQSGAVDLVQSGGRIFVAGWALPRANKSHGFLAALTSQGRLDRTFGRGGVTRDLARWSTPTQLLAVGRRLFVLEQWRSPALLAFRPDGSPDRRFSRAATGGLVQRLSSRAITVQDGQLIFAWSQRIRRTKHRSGFSRLRLARLRS